MLKKSGVDPPAMWGAAAVLVLAWASSWSHFHVCLSDFYNCMQISPESTLQNIRIALLSRRAQLILYLKHAAWGDGPS